MRTNIFFRNLWVAVILMQPLSEAKAVTSADYYKAGVQLYTAKNYPQAIQYFSAALSLDPNNPGALQGRANCYYAQGQYQEALNDYQKVQAASPSPQLTQFIQALQAKVGAVSPTGGAGLPGAPSSGSFEQGVALYQQRQYASAIPQFQKAVQENPNDGKAYYYLGVTQMMVGDMKNAALNLTLSDKKQPNPSVQAYVNQLRSRLTPQDLEWVDGQVAAALTASGASVSSGGVGKPKSFGIRLEPALSLLSLDDFTTYAETSKAAAATVQQLYDSTYAYSGEVPSGSINFSFEPVLRVSPNFELGLPIGYMPVGTAKNDIHNSNGVTFTDSLNISTVLVGLNARYLIGNDSFQPFIGVGPLLAMMNIDYQFDYKGVGQASASGNFTGMGFGVQAQLGVDWHLGDTFVISPFAGYQLASANSFQSTVSGANGSNQTAQLQVVPSVYGNVITPVADGNLILPIYGGSASTQAPTGSRPLVVDLSGLKAGIQISAFF